MKKTIILITILKALTLPILAQNSEVELSSKANDLFEQGMFVQAHPIYSQLVSLHPRNEEYNWRFGASTAFSGADYETAIKHLKFACQNKGIDARAFYYLGLSLQLNYDFDEANNAYKSFISLAEPSVKAKFDVTRRMEQCNNGKGLLSQIKDLMVLEKTPARESDFFRFFNLEGLGGRILAMPEELKSREDQRKGGNALIYYPGNASVVYFASYGKDGANGKDLFRANILPGGKFSVPEKLQGMVNTPYDEDYAFMHPNGKTLFFASKGHNSMGGYDIFRSDYDEATGQFLKPINLDFAINTPDDDIMFVTDSAQHLACFASGRSSAMGELHVYKVRVKGIPVQAVFIQGVFASLVTPESKKAKIKVVDELSGRIIESTFSSNESGEYILQLPKSGKYRIGVEGEGSPVNHEVDIDIPFYDEPVVLRQEIKLVIENGAEKIQVINHFEEPLSDQVAEYTAMLMRKKAALDVNASKEDLIAADKEDQTLTVALTVQNAPQLAGYPAGTSAEQIVNDLDNRSTQYAQEAEQLNENAQYTAGYAIEEEEKGMQLLADSKTIIDGANKNDMPSWIAAMTEYQLKVNQAEVHLVNASMALQVSVELENASRELTKRTDEIQRKSNELKQLLASQEIDGLVKKLEEVKISETSDMQTIGGSEIASAAKQNVRNAEEENRKSGERLARLRTEESALQMKVRSLEQRLTISSNKENAALQIELKAAQSDLEITRDNIEREGNRFAHTEQVRMDYQTQATIIDKIAVADAVGQSFSKIVLNADARTQKQGSLKSMISQAREMKLEDEERLALIDPETRITSKDLISEAQTNETNSNLDVALKPVSEIHRNFDSAIAAVPQELTSEEKAILRNIITSKKIASLDLRENKLRSLRTSPEADLTAIDMELYEIAKSRGEALINLSFTGDLDSVKAENALAGFLENQAPIDFTSDNPISQIRQIQWRQENLAGAINKKEQIEQQLLKGGDVATIQPLIAQWNGLTMLITISMKDELALQRAQKDFVGRFKAEPNAQSQILFRQEWASQLEQLKNGILMSAENAPLQIADLNKAIAILSDEYRLSSNALTLKQADDNLVQNTDRKDTRAIETSANISPEQRKDTDFTANGSNANSVAQSIQPKNLVDSTALEVISEASFTDANIISAPEAEKNAVKYSFEIGQMPLETSALILALVSDYPEQMLDSTAEEAVESSIRSAFDSKLLSEIKVQVLRYQQFLPSITEATDKSIALEELSKLEALKDQIEMATKELEEEDPATSSIAYVSGQDSTSIITPVEASDNTETELQQTYDFVFSPAEAYEPGNIYQTEIFEALVNRNEDPAMALQNLSLINELHAEISTKKEAIKSERSRVKQMKIDRQIEGLYTQVGQMEIDNAEKISQMAALNFAENLKEIDSLKRSHEAIIGKDNDLKVRFEEYQIEAEYSMAEALKIRGNTQSLTDPIEKNYILRGAFVLEAKALEYQQKCIAILRNAEQLIDYKNQYDITDSTLIIEEITEEQNSEIHTADFVNANEADAIEALEGTAGIHTELTEEAIANTVSESVVSNESYLEANSREMVSDNNVSDTSDDSATSLAAEEILLNAELYQSAGADSIGEKVENFELIAEQSDIFVESLEEGEAIQENKNEYLGISDVISSEVFDILATSPYGEGRPIPIDAPMPEGLIYKVQVGAFRNPIPADHFGGFAPLYGERIREGITRYTAGLFLEFESADKAKKAIRANGYSDAFVVAYYNGKRISLNDAFAQRSVEPVIGSNDLIVADNQVQVTEGNLQEVPQNDLISFGKQVITDKSEDPIMVLGSDPIIFPGKDTFSPGSDATEYYTSVKDAAKANQVEVMKGLFYTVQIGVYSKPAPAKDLFYISPLNSEKLLDGKIRYTTGVYSNLSEALQRKDSIVKEGIADAFITAYFNGSRIPLNEAEQIFALSGTSILAIDNAFADASAPEEVYFELFIGRFEDSVPADVARALLLMEEKVGIERRIENNGVAYYTSKLDTIDAAKMAVKEFNSYGVTGINIAEYRNGKLVSE
jgi:hypothetical protein